MIELKPVSHYDPRYKFMRGRHYIPDRSTIGMQLHYLVMLDQTQVGIISAASPTWAVKPRDEFFGLDLHPGKRGAQLRHIVNNSVFSGVLEQSVSVQLLTIISDCGTTSHRTTDGSPLTNTVVLQ